MSISDPLRTFIVRHAESEANVNGTIDTKAPGGPLTPKGVKQAEKLAETLQNLKCEVAAIYVSPFLRAQQTAKILARTLKVNTCDIYTNEKIKELYWGELNGITSSNAAAKEMSRFLEEVAKGNYLHRLGRSGENQLELLRRLYEFLIDVWKKHKGQTVIVVTHSTVATVIQKIVLRALGKREKHKSLGNAEFCKIVISETDMRKINKRKQILDRDFRL